MPLSIQSFGLRSSFPNKPWVKHTFKISEDMKRLVFIPAPEAPGGETVLPAMALRSINYPFGMVGCYRNTAKIAGMVLGYEARLTMAKPRMLYKRGKETARGIHLVFAPPPAKGDAQQQPPPPPIHINLRFPDRPAFVITLVVIHRAKYPNAPPLTRGRILWMIALHHTGRVLRDKRLQRTRQIVAELPAQTSAPTSAPPAQPSADTSSANRRVPASRLC